MTTDNENIREHDLDSLEKILSQVKPIKEIEDLEEELEELNILTKRLSTHTNKLLDILDDIDTPTAPQRMHSTPKKPRVSGTYIASQLSNLIGIKNLKLQVLKQRESLKSSALDRAVRILTLMDKGKEDSRNELPYNQILNMMVNMGVQLPLSKEKDMVLLEDETNIDNELLSIMEEKNIDVIKVSTVEDVSDTDIIPTKIFLDSEVGKFYLVDDEFNISTEVNEDELDDIEKDDGSIWSKRYNLPIVSSID